jgi:hypothetical protein
MYACLHEIGSGFFGEVCGRENQALTYFSRPSPTTLAFAN